MDKKEGYMDELNRWKARMEKDSKAVEWIFSCIIMRRNRIRCQFDRSGRYVL